MTARLICVNDLYSFDPTVQVRLDEFTDIVGRNFTQPKEGLGFDGSPTAHIEQAADKGPSASFSKYSWGALGRGLNVAGLRLARRSTQPSSRVGQWPPFNSNSGAPPRIWTLLDALPVLQRAADSPRRISSTTDA